MWWSWRESNPRPNVLHFASYNHKTKVVRPDYLSVQRALSFIKSHHKAVSAPKTK
ncbi:hypothetical protein [Xanthomonas phage JGB6]|nr:hypothetical protein [Xanthomonas phage JGB6]